MQSSESNVSPSLTRSVLSRVERLYRAIGRDFGEYPSRLAIELFGTHRAYRRALWLQQRQLPQSDTDNSSSIVHDTLLLGPLPSAYLRHNLAHVYTEWLIDRLTGNKSDALPSTPWLYDGLAEYEAYRYAPADLPCSGSAGTLMNVTAIRTARRWREIRAGPLGSLEYCAAYLRVRALIVHVGWGCVMRALREGSGWTDAARQLLRMDRTPVCSGRV